MEKSTKFCINPEVLKWARIMTGYAPDVAAKKIGISKDLLLKWENGEEETPISKIRILGRIYKIATTVLLFNFVPQENVSPKFRKIFYENINLFTTDTLLAIRGAIRIQNLAKDAFGLQNNSFLLELKKMSGLKYGEIAIKIINLLGLNESEITKAKDDYEQLNLWKNAIEAKGIYVIEVGFSTDEAKGFAIYDDFAPIITLNTNDHPRVRIFTLLHELSHFVYDGDSIDDDKSLLSYDNDPLETKCNYLAGHIVVPSGYLDSKVALLQLNPSEDIDTALEVLSNVFNVSKQVTLRRLYIQDYIQREVFLRIHNKAKGFPYRDWKKKQKGGDFYVKFLKNNSKAFVYDILDAYRVNKIGHFEVLNFLNIKSSTLSKLENRL